MLNESEKDLIESQLEELQNFILHTKDIREWKRGQAVKLRFQGFSYREIEKRLEVSKSFIAQTQSKYLSLGIAGLKLKYQGVKSYLTTEQLSSTIQWLSRLENRNISELERYLMTNYDVVFKSRESYYRILKAGQLSWQKAKVENSRKQPDIIKKNAIIAELLSLHKPEIEAGELVVYALDECHLQGDDICNYLWGNSQERTVVKLDNQRDRQTYYGALNLVSQEFIVKPYKAGNGENTVKFVEELKRMNPQPKILLIWDGASYHLLSRNAAATSQRKRR